MAVNILYQDEHLLLCEKPVGLLSQAGEGDTLPARLEAAAGGQIYPVHRLDAGVGGLMVYARTKPAAGALSEAIRQRAFVKEYLCVASGCPDPAGGTMEDLLFWDASRGKSFPVSRMRKGVKPASLSYKTLSQRDGLALMAVSLHTGRTHQIRVQFASRRHPLLGDRRYGSSGSGGIALWSWHLAFSHPFTGQAMDFTLPPPPAFPWSLFPCEAVPQRP